MSRPVALVTGAGRGIGAATVAALARDGWKVVAVDRCAPDPAVPYEMATVDDLEAVVRPFPSATAVQADVADGDAMTAVVADLGTDGGGLDAVVCAAGIVAGGVPLWEVSVEEWSAVMATDLTGVFNTVRAAVPALLETHDVPGLVVSVVADGRTLLAKGYGWADLEKRRPMDGERTIVRVASISKLVTATAAMQLVAAGKLELHRDVNENEEFDFVFVDEHHVLDKAVFEGDKMIGHAVPAP